MEMLLLNLSTRFFCEETFDSSYYFPADEPPAVLRTGAALWINNEQGAGLIRTIKTYFIRIAENIQSTR